MNLINIELTGWYIICCRGKNSKFEVSIGRQEKNTAITPVVMKKVNTYCPYVKKLISTAWLYNLELLKSEGEKNLVGSLFKVHS